MKKLKRPLVIIFGATGDLNKRKLIPALYGLVDSAKIDPKTPVVCVSRSNLERKEFIARLEMRKFISKASQNKINEFAKTISYFSVDFTSCRKGNCPKCTKCKDLHRYIQDIRKKYSTDSDTLFYLATPQSTFENISRIIQKSKLALKKGKAHLAFEKPFGHDRKSAKLLNSVLSSMFSEKQIYRVDHYLGKALVQDLLLFRFSNTIYEHIWNSKYIDNIQITISESIGVENRGNFYDKNGCIRDVLQNHLMQLVALVAMERPKNYSAEAIRGEMAKVLKALKLPVNDDVVVGQYKNNGIKGIRNRPGYREEQNVPRDSKTETLAAVRMQIKNERWRGTPIYLRTGKRLQNTYAEINIVLKTPTKNLNSTNNPEANIISIRIQPDRGISLVFNLKKPGPEHNVMPVKMDFCHHCLTEINSSEAYESLIINMLSNDQTIFTSWDCIDASWRYIDKLQEIKSNKRLVFYKAGDNWPSAVLDLVGKNKRKWVER